jgi:FAD/FMN-containing dehydrogenase
MLRGLVAGAIVLGFDPAARSWVTEANAAGPFDGLPSLDGTLVTDPAVLGEYADDWGHIIHRMPLAVLRAGSVNDVVKMVKFANAHGLRIVSRGNGHTTFGQSQVAAGVVIDLRGLNQIHAITNTHADVDAGVVWADLVRAAAAVGRTPPVLTDYTDLTIGGTLSVGGIGGMSFRHGAEVDNVDELTVVTGAGDVVTCSPKRNADLFNVALAGLGLCAIIVRASIRLIKARERALSVQLFYTDLPTMLRDLRTVTDENRFDYARTQSMPTGNGFVHFMEVTTYYTPDDDSPDDDDDDDHIIDDARFAGLSFIPGSAQVADRTYVEYCELTNVLFDEILEPTGLNALPHVWLDIFVPGSAIDTFGPQTVAGFDPASFLPGSVLLFFAFKRNRTRQPMFRVPDEDTYFLFDIIRTAPPVPDVVNAVVADNRRIYEANRALGGTSYVISSVPMSRADWQQHYGPVWPLLTRVKATYDPRNVLGAGVSVFG